MQRDKTMHAAVGALVALALAALQWIISLWGMPLGMLCAAAGIGVAYELVQKIRGEGTPDPQDALATAVGGAIIAIGWAIAWA